MAMPEVPKLIAMPVLGSIFWGTISSHLLVVCPVSRLALFLLAETKSCCKGDVSLLSYFQIFMSALTCWLFEGDDVM